MNSGYCWELPPPRVAPEVLAERILTARYLAGEPVRPAPSPKRAPLAPSERLYTSPQTAGLSA